MATVTGYVERIKYRNEDNGYSVLSVADGGEEYILVGTFPYISEGERIEATGRMVEHSIYGEQLAVESYEIKAPEDTLAIERYLGSGAIKCIGAALAKRIVKKFKADTFRIMEEEPERLAEVKGVSERMAMEICSQVEEKRDMRQAMVFLQQYGISMNLAVKIYQHYGPKMYSVIQENPYQLADDIQGVGFKIADEIAAKVGIFTDSDYRIRSGLFYALLQATGNGHTYLPEEELFANASALLNVEPEHMEKHLVDLQMEKKLVVKEKDGKRIVYPAQFYYMELNTARMLHDLNLHSKIDEEDVKKRLQKITEAEKIELDELQEQAVLEAVSNGLLIITGGPGTGKTTTINTIIHYFEQEDMDILLAAPTGRAAKRMTEATGYEAKTIHRLLELTGAPTADPKNNGNSGENRLEGMHFERNEENPLDADVIIIDEMSMVDISLIHSLLKAVNVGTRLILVGDVNQLPSVGPGNVLRDMIASEAFPVVKLTKIFRQAAQSAIIRNAHMVDCGQLPDLKRNDNDFFFLTRRDGQSAVDTIVDLCRRRLPERMGIPADQIQVLSPTRRRTTGTKALNQALQAALNPPLDGKGERRFGDWVFRAGDRVMQVKNNYDVLWREDGGADSGMGMFNGDIGVVRTIDRDVVTVDFDGRVVEYTPDMLGELEPAFAVTVHKAQGAEYRAVILAALDGAPMLLSRSVLYTAITRAKELFIIVGDDQTVAYMVANDRQTRRYSGLRARLAGEDT